MGSFMREKDINLAIVLELGAIIERNFKDVKVVYSRKTDKYLTLQERADVVNNNHADLFLCIHTNSNPNPSASGTESYTLGLAKTKANLDVAMRENSVIMLEKDYQSKYKGFDPNSVDSYIMFEFMQDKYIDKSLDMASNVQKQFVSFSNRTDRGVRQAGFWVLHRSACPSVLIEVGFVSNPAEERYLSSDIGRNEIAKAIYNAFIYYKHDHDKKSGIQNVFVPKREVPEPKEQEIKKIETLKRAPIERAETTQVVAKTIIPTTQLPTKTQSAPAKKSYDQVQSQKVADTKTDPTKNLTFKVQLFATRLNLNPNAAEFKGVQNVEFFVENGLKKYTLGAENEYPRIEKIRASILSKFPDAFVIVFDGDRKLSPKEAALLTK
jgi:N-acetylmuramoyl-L-alanine amidase